LAFGEPVAVVLRYDQPRFYELRNLRWRRRQVAEYQSATGQRTPKVVRNNPGKASV